MKKIIIGSKVKFNYRDIVKEGKVISRQIYSLDDLLVRVPNNKWSDKGENYMIKQNEIIK